MMMTFGDGVVVMLSFLAGRCCEVPRTRWLLRLIGNLGAAMVDGGEWAFANAGAEC